MLLDLIILFAKPKSEFWAQWITLRGRRADTDVEACFFHSLPDAVLEDVVLGYHLNSIIDLTPGIFTSLVCGSVLFVCVELLQNLSRFYCCTCHHPMQGNGGLALTCVKPPFHLVCGCVLVQLAGSKPRWMEVVLWNWFSLLKKQPAFFNPLKMMPKNLNIIKPAVGRRVADAFELCPKCMEGRTKSTTLGWVSTRLMLHG